MSVQESAITVLLQLLTATQPAQIVRSSTEQDTNLIYFSQQQQAMRQCRLSPFINDPSPNINSSVHTLMMPISNDSQVVLLAPFSKQSASKPTNISMSIIQYRMDIQKEQDKQSKSQQEGLSSQMVSSLSESQDRPICETLKQSKEADTESLIGEHTQSSKGSIWLSQFDEQSISLPHSDSPSPDNSICELLQQITNTKSPPLVPQQYRILCGQTKIRLCLNSYAKVSSQQRQRSRSLGRNKVVFLLPFYYDRRLQKATPVVKPRNRQSTRFFEFQLDQADAERCAFTEGDREKTNAGKVAAVSNRCYFSFDVVYTSKILPRSRRITAEESEAVVQSIVRESFRLARRNFDSDILIPEFENGSLNAIDTGMSLIRNIVQSISFYTLRGENLPFREVTICTRKPQVYIGWVSAMQTAFRTDQS